jgi:hypothetical protein
MTDIKILLLIIILILTRRDIERWFRQVNAKFEAKRKRKDEELQRYKEWLAVPLHVHPGLAVRPGLAA